MINVNQLHHFFFFARSCYLSIKVSHLLTHIERLLGQRVSLGFVLLEDGLNLEQGLCLESADPVREGDGAVHGSQGPAPPAGFIYTSITLILAIVSKEVLCAERTVMLSMYGEDMMRLMEGGCKRN